MSTQLASARSFIEAVQSKNEVAAAALCAGDVEVLLRERTRPFEVKTVCAR